MTHQIADCKVTPEFICPRFLPNAPLFVLLQSWVATLNGGKVLPNVEVVVAPPSLYLDRVSDRLRTDFGVAAQVSDRPSAHLSMLP